MSLEPLDVRLGERTFTIAQLPAMRALRLAARLGRVAGPALASALVSGGLNASALPALGSLFDRLSPEELETVTRELLAGATVHGADGKRLEVLVGFDVLFQGRLHEVLQLLQAALKLNFGESFAALVAAASTQDSKAASDSSSTSH